MLVRECEYEEQVWYKCGGVWTGSQTIALGTLAQQRQLGRTGGPLVCSGDQLR